MTTILAIGSPFGADRVGWQMAEQLQQLDIVQVHTCRHPIDLLPYFQEANHCVIVDALWSELHSGKLVEVKPAELKQEYCRSSHGLNLYDVIQLAKITEQLPLNLKVFGVEISGRSAYSFSDQEVSELVEELVQKLHLEKVASDIMV